MTSHGLKYGGFIYNFEMKPKQIVIYIEREVSMVQMLVCCIVYNRN